MTLDPGPEPGRQGTGQAKQQWGVGFGQVLQATRCSLRSGPTGRRLPRTRRTWRDLDHLTYQSLEDWRGLRDIVRCNPSFHGYSRYDSILFNSDLPGLSFARLRTMFRCTLETKRQFDVAIVRQFRRSKWKPRTDWAGCQVYEETKEYSLLLMDYVMRGALLTPVTASGKDNLHYFVDSTDADMFLRADTQ
ncbi:hypothetical protein C8R43DRAFT_882009 [Mycena crocata]|nr:hypothetical protein C8R43DRAFT_1177903 [Mycena crocata]KAJ7159174.1 hypothetical protein C8R43DRAFT_881939 [Mycena crocata]KAJ7159175.1 hypothetical protein C8R43DRAFT_882009 [Mycena crocata]